jgi:catechol 2,3-dioxygenase-like lactoylglutathione lyase family enzyme
MATKKRKAARKKKTAPRKRSGSMVEFNHAMIYTARFAESLDFYSTVLGFKVLDSYPGAYARLKSAGGTTIALHCLDTGQQMDARTEGVRLYFEVKALDGLCSALEQKGVKFDQMPKDMPWGWRHAYLHDPDGHEVSLYWAGKARFAKTVMRRG